MENERVGKSQTDVQGLSFFGLSVEFIVVNGHFHLHGKGSEAIETADRI